MRETLWLAAAGSPDWASPAQPFPDRRIHESSFVRKPFARRWLHVYQEGESKIMKGLCIVITATLLAGICLAQIPDPQSKESPQQSEASQAVASNERFAPGVTFRAELEKTIDAKKADPGDAVFAKTMDELKSGTQVIAPRGARIVGHVVAAAPHEKNSPSRLEIAFDKLELGNGSDIPIKAIIQALAKPVIYAPMGPDNMGQPMAGSTPMAAGGRSGGMIPGTMGQPSQAPNPASMGNAGGTPSQSNPSSIASDAQGVVGMSGVSLSAGPTQGSVLTSEKHNVKLESGTQMVLRVQ
jgi:hypothetical protein